MQFNEFVSNYRLILLKKLKATFLSAFPSKSSGSAIRNSLQGALANAGEGGKAPNRRRPKGSLGLFSSARRILFFVNKNDIFLAYIC